VASGKVITVNDSDFESMVVKNDIPCLVDFWAPWCGPCKAIGPLIDELAKEFTDKVQIVKMNVDESPATPGKFGIKAIPTLIMFKNGEAVDRITGAAGKTQLQDLINKAV
jgi:thioredoxin 1